MSVVKDLGLRRGGYRTHFRTAKGQTCVIIHKHWINYNDLLFRAMLDTFPRSLFLSGIYTEDGVR